MAAWEQNTRTHRVQRHLSVLEEGVKGEDLCRKEWTSLNRLRTEVGRYRSSMKKWGLADGAAYECGVPEQTADHIIKSCPLHRPPSEAGIFEVGPLTRAWLQHNELTPLVNDQLNGLTEGSSQMNTWPAAQMSPGPLGGV